jgi:hypothetical protein
MLGKVFSDDARAAKVYNFYQTLYGLDKTFVEQNIVPTFKGVLP